MHFLFKKIFKIFALVCVGSVGWVLSHVLYQKVVQFPFRAHAWVEGLIPSRMKPVSESLSSMFLSPSFLRNQ